MPLDVKNASHFLYGVGVRYLTRGLRGCRVCRCNNVLYLRGVPEDEDAADEEE